MSCFTPGTKIATQKGECAVETLVVGDKILTRDNGIQTLRWVGQRNIDYAQLVAKPHLRPVMLRAGALGGGLPEDDMLVSPNHRLLVAAEYTALELTEHEALVPAKHLVNQRDIRVVDMLGVHYVQLVFGRHEVVMANGVWAEAFHPGDYSLNGMGNAQRSEIHEIFPEMKDVDLPVARTVSHARLHRFGLSFLRH